MSSVGQAVGYIGGAIIGSFVGYPMLGAAIGGMIGSAIDPPKGPNIQGPRLNDLSVQTASYGQTIPRIYGTAPVSGNVFWIENNSLKEHEESESQGGKGGGGQTVTSYWYSSTFAIGLCEGPIAGVRRIWCSGKLIYDAGSDALGAVMASNVAAEGFRIYLGTDTQQPDTRMEASLGVGNVPAYRGLAYIVFDDFDLTNYGNSLAGAQFKFEVINTATSLTESVKAASLIDITATSASAIGSVRVNDDRVQVTSIIFNIANFDLYAAHLQHYTATASEFSYDGIATIPAFTDAYLHAKSICRVVQSDVDVTMFALSQNPTVHFLGYSPTGVKVFDSGPFAPSVLPYEVQHCLIDRGEIFFSANSASLYKIYKMPFGVWGSMPESNAGIPGDLISTASGYNISEMSASENYLYAVDRTASSNTSTSVLKFARDSLAYVETFTAAFRGTQAKIIAVGDDDFYTLTNQGVLVHWVDGVATDTGLRYAQYATVFYETWFVRLAPGVFCVLRPVAVDSVTTPADLYVFYKYLADDTAQLPDIVEAECLKSALLSAADIDVSALSQEVRGYRVSQVAAIRSALEPLQAAWPFDAIQDGYQISFIPRGQSSVASISNDDLGASTPGDRDVIRVSESREMDSQLPRRVLLTYLDMAREYDVNEQSAERLNTDAVNVRTVEMPIVLNSDEAAQMAERLLFLWWLERRDLSFALPPTFRHLQPADVVTIAADSATFEARLTGCSYLPDGRIECTAKYNDAPIYASTAVGASPPFTGQVVAWSGSTQAQLMDLPALDDEFDKAGFYAVIYGETASWPGGVLMQSVDEGQTWNPAQAYSNTSPAVAVVLDDSGPVRFDCINSRTINARRVCGTLSSVTDLQLYGGANHFAYGADGRWEIIAARTCTDLGDNSWRLTDIHSGRFGTEWASALHQGNDALVALTTNSVRFIGKSLNDIGLQQLYRAVTQGRTVDSAPDNALAYRGMNLECLSPVEVRGVRASSNDWSIDWVRRTRIGGEWRDRIEAPLSESSESYVVEIYGESGRTTLKRTITATSTSITYTSAQQTTDFGASQSSLYVNVYQVSEHVGVGIPAVVTLNASVATSSPPYMQRITTDAHWSSVVLAMHMDGSDGGTTFTDVKGHTMTRYSVTTETESYKYGTASAYFPGNVNYYLTTPAVSDFLLGSGDFTVDFWVKVNAVSNGKVVGIWSDTSGTGFSWKVRVGDGLIAFAYSTTGANSTFFTTSGLSIGTTTWRFIEVSRSGSNLYFFLDGVKVATHNIGSVSFYAVSSSKLLEIGRDSAGPGDYISAYIDDLRVTKGVCRHTADYTVPFAAFPETS